MSTFINHTDTLIKELVFDQQLINAIKEAKIDEGLLYNHLMNGKITMQEYLHLCKN